MTLLLLTPIALLLLAWLAFALRYRAPLTRLWREPVLKRPTLAIESDDWGAGPAIQAERLRALVERLERHHDADGRPALMTIAVVLATADTEAMADADRHIALSLDDPSQQPIRDALIEGAGRGVFALQLHGMYHYWPATVMAVADQDAVRQWLAERPAAGTESLPSHLQSRWTDASALPSSDHSDADIMAAADEETALFERCFARRARVVVPPTFVWNPAVEAAWADAGVEVLVSPGRRFDARDADGRPREVAGERHYNGQRSAARLAHIIRDDYFEPDFGHRAEQALDALAAKWATRRPCLLETHRWNFIGDEAAMQANTDEIDRLLGAVLKRYPDLRFAGPERLAQAFADNDPDLIDSRIGARLLAFSARLNADWSLRKPGWLLGIVPLTRAFGTLLPH